MNEQEKMEEIYDDLFYFVRTNDIEELKNLLKNENIQNMNIKDENGNSLLHYACANNLVDMILFLLYECTVDYNESNSFGNTPLLWSIQNKHYEAVKELLFFDYYLHKKNYVKVEKKKNEVYEQFRTVHEQMIKEEYRLDSEIKQKINALPCIYSMYENICDEKEEAFEQYRKRNQINLLQKNSYEKSVLSETFNIENENILHLILSHPISVVLDNKDDLNENTKVHFSKGNEEEVYGNDESSHSVPEVNNVNNAIIVQEQVQEVLLNQNMKIRETPVVIKIREIGLNYYGNCLDNQQYENDITGINIWEACVILSKWLSDLCLQNPDFFKNKNVLELGAGTGLASISLFLYAALMNPNQGIDKFIISDINSFSLQNINHNIQLNEELLNQVDTTWKHKLQVSEINWAMETTYPKKKDTNEIVTFDLIIGSDLIYDQTTVPLLLNVLRTLKQNGTFLYVCRKNRDGVTQLLEELQKFNFHIEYVQPCKHYADNPFINVNQELFEMKFSEMDIESFIMIKCQRKS